MDRLYSDDFNMVESNINGRFVRIEELNKMIECGVIKIDKEKLLEYKFDNTVNYNKNISKEKKKLMIEFWKEYLM